MTAAFPRIVSSLGFSLYVFAICLVLALLEIQIEGANGWASALPTWRFGPPWLLRLTSGKPVTGYHVWLNSLLLLWLHLPFWFAPWNLAAEFLVAGIYYFMAVQWDFLWFVLNPHFGLKRFNRDHVAWFSHWFAGLPSDYYGGLVLSLGSWLIAAAIAKTPLLERAWRWSACLLVFVALSLAAVLAASWRSRQPGPSQPAGRP